MLERILWTEEKEAQSVKRLVGGGRTNEAKTVVIHIRTKKTLSTAQTTNDKNLHLSVITPNINGFGSSSKDID